jgi:serine/threonine protein kinase
MLGSVNRVASSPSAAPTLSASVASGPDDGPLAAVESGFAPTELSAPGSAQVTPEAALDTPEAAAPDTDLPDVLVDLEFDVPPARADLAADPTLSHIGRYALKHRIGVGGLGTVYEAWDPLLSRSVAVKTLHFAVDTPSRLSLDGLFLNEARTAAGLSHRYIVTVHDAGLSAQGVYIAMERLHGRDLRDALAHGWRPSPERAALLMRRVCDAVSYAHHRGVIHCDLKPANIFLTRRWRPKVLDFGISRATGVAAPALEGLVAGSPHHLAPEQLDGGEVDVRTDVYALGTVLYELLTGRKAFDGRSLEEIVAAVRSGRVVPVRQWNPEVSDGLAEVAMQALSHNPAHRFASAHDMALALRPWQSSEGSDTVHTRAVSTPPSGRSGSDGLARTAGGALHRGPKVGRRVGLLAVLGLGAAALAVTALWAGRSASSTPADRPAMSAPALAAPAATVPSPSATAEATDGGPSSMVAAGAAPALGSTSDTTQGPGASTSGQSTGQSTGQSPGSSPDGRPPVAAAQPTAARTPEPARAGARDAAPRPRPPRPNETTRTTPAGTAAAPAAAGAAVALGTVQIAVSPWGHVEVDGRAAGTTPPLTQLSLPEGRHTVTIRNADFPAYTTTVVVSEDRPVVVRHRFGP